jgi:hypothetical protein
MTPPAFSCPLYSLLVKYLHQDLLFIFHTILLIIYLLFNFLMTSSSLNPFTLSQGFGSAPKFPRPSEIEFLFHAHIWHKVGSFCTAA